MYFLDIYVWILLMCTTMFDKLLTLMPHDCPIRVTASSLQNQPEKLERESEIFPSALYLMYYSDVIMGTMASQITSLTIVYSTVYSGADQRKHQSSTSLAFVRENHRWPVISPHKCPVTRKCFHLMTSSWRHWEPVKAKNAVCGKQPVYISNSNTYILMEVARHGSEMNNVVGITRIPTTQTRVYLLWHWS